ncbi:MAG: apolipoprotein N-acyltransferase [Rhodocyclaceae bacterium]|nr:apolipoprotein N-acyltransferase [Rhodocyclaceae bacterium]
MSLAPFLIAAVLGSVSVAGFAPLELFPLPIIALAGLLRLWQDTSTPHRAALLGFIWGLGFFLTGVSWVYVSLHDVGGMAAPLAVIATVLFCCWLAVFPALVGYLYRRLMQTETRAGFWRNALLFAGLWVLSEWLRGVLFTGFPWLALGYSQTPPSPLAGFAAVLGSYGVGGLAALIAAALALGLRRRGTWLLIIALLGSGALLRGMDWTQPVGAPFRVSLLQGNIPQSLKWVPERLPLSIDTYTGLAQAHPAALTVLPETALPLFFHEVPREVLQALTQHGDALVGTAVRLREGGYVNGAIAIQRSTAPVSADAVLPAPTLLAPHARPTGISSGHNPGSLPPMKSPEAVTGGLTSAWDGPAPTFSTQTYAKQHLVPFGEYVPPGFAWFFGLVNIPLSDFSAGPPRQAPITLSAQPGVNIAPNICYEDLFGEEIIRALPGATLLINLSNTAWFGDSLAQPQHLQIARLRALETGRMMLRATNTGITAAIAPDGRVLGALPPFTAGALRVEAQAFAGLTPYARWGNLLALLLALIAVIYAGLPALMIALRQRRSR